LININHLRMANAGPASTLGRVCKGRKAVSEDLAVHYPRS
jgi:hypothetical protein